MHSERLLLHRSHMAVWFWNLSSKHRPRLATELAAGTLRQGWGYRDDLDLRRLKDTGLSDDAHAAAWQRCKAMIESIEPQDLVCVKGVLDGRDGAGFTVVRVTGAYRFEEPEEELGGDFRHALPVEPVASFHYDAAPVSAALAAALRRARHPIRRAGRHADAVSRLPTGTFDTAEGVNVRKEALRRQVLDAIRDGLQRLSPREFEEIVGTLLEHLGYTKVRHTAGRSERGADHVATYTLPGGMPVYVVVQVKHHQGEHNDPHGLDQIETALLAHKAQAGLLVSSAPKISELLLERITSTDRVEVLFGDRLYTALFQYLADDAGGLDAALDS